MGEMYYVDVVLCLVLCYHTIMPHQRCCSRILCAIIWLVPVMLAACTSAMPVLAPTVTLAATPAEIQTPKPSPPLTVTPSPAPTPTPTVTPIPPLGLEIAWPEHTSALQPVPVEVALIPPPGVAVTATVEATVLGPGGQPRWRMALSPKGGNLYAADEPLQLPLEPPEGRWLVVVYVESALPVIGEQHITFQPTLLFHDLGDAVPAQVRLRVPQDFAGVVTGGDEWAGVRVWQYGNSQLGLWWAPGPVEPLLLNNAITMLEATYGSLGAATVLDVEEAEWQGQRAFLFREQWSGTEGGPAETMVVQGPDYWLYALRLRAIGGEAIPAVLYLIRDTFTFDVE
jgi:hypothetical protein